MKARWIVRVAALCATMLAGSVVTAQTKVQNTGFRENRLVDDTLLQKGRMEVGIQSAGMWTSDAAEADGVEFKATNFYANPAAAFGYQVIDNLQLRAALGYLVISTSNNDVVVQNLGAFLGTAQAIYHVPLRLGTALYLGAGGGYFTGSTDRPGAEESSTISNSTSGFAGQGLLGLLLQPGPMFLVRGGIRFDALVGTETPSIAGASDISTTNLKLMGDFAVGLRF